MPNPYPALPGFSITTIDGRLGIVPDAPTTNSLLIIGSALDGPNDRVVRLRPGMSIDATYGPIAFNRQYVGPSGEISGFSGNYLAKAYREATRAGVTDVRFLRVGGWTASGTYTMPAVNDAGVTGTIFAYARNPGRLYNSVTITFTSGATSGKVTIAQPSVKGGSITYQFTYGASGIHVSDLIDTINSLVTNASVKLAIGTVSPIAEARRLHGTVQLAGGTDGTIWDDLKGSNYPFYAAITDADNGAFAILDDYECDVILLAGVYIDDAVDNNGGSSDSTKSFAVKFAQFLGARSVSHYMQGVIGTRPLQDGSTRAKWRDHYNNLIDVNSGTRSAGYLKAGYFMYSGFAYSDANTVGTIDAGGQLSVVAADVLYSDADIGNYPESFAATYAGMLCVLPAQEPPTYKYAPGILALPYTFGSRELNGLSQGVGRDTSLGRVGGGAYVTLRVLDGVGAVITRGVTAAGRGSDFADVQKSRIVAAVHKAMKQVGRPYLGRPQEKAIIQSLRTDIVTWLDAFAEAGGLLGKEGVGYTLNLSAGGTSSDFVLGRIVIDLVLRPPFEIKSIEVSVQLSAPA